MGRGLLFAASGVAEGLSNAFLTKGAEMREARIRGEGYAFQAAQGEINRAHATAEAEKSREHATILANQSHKNSKEVAGMRMASAEKIAKTGNDLTREVTAVKVAADAENLQLRIRAEKEALEARIAADQKNMTAKLKASIEETILKLESAEQQLQDKLAVTVIEGKKDRSQKEVDSQRDFIGDVMTGLYSDETKAGRAISAAENRGLLPDAPVAVPEAAVTALKQNPALKDQFIAKYGERAYQVAMNGG